VKRLPRGFRRGHDDSLACVHRDCSCCRECAAKHAEIVEVGATHFWVPDAAERAEIAKIQGGAS
jgi:hypothetical protein